MARVTARALALAALLAVVVVGTGAGVAAGADTTAPDCSTVGYEGSGTASDPWQVTNASQLQCMGDGSTSTALSDSFRLVSDVDLTGTEQWNGGAGFDPIGGFSLRFDGTLDGANHTIRNLTIDRPSENGVSLFVSVAGTVRDVQITGASVSGEDGTGILAGRAEGASVRNVSVTGSVDGVRIVGGLVGNYTYGTIADTTADVTVTGTNSQIGGLVGSKGSGLVVRSSASGAVDAPGASSVGGLAGSTGEDGGAGPAEITDSYATATVVGGTRAGGLIGFVGSTDLTDSYATGDVSGTDRVGGLVGENRGTIDTTYVVGSVDGSSDVGGLVGFDDGGSVGNSYWDVTATGQSTSDGGTGLFTDQMLGDPARTNMSALAFGRTWDVVDGPKVSYPSLLNNTQAPEPGLRFDYYAGGDGSPARPYLIADWTHLANVSERPEAAFRLVADLNRSTTGYDAVANASANGGLGFDPIGNASTPFDGTFDGANHTIGNLTVDRPNGGEIGLFGVLERGGTVGNLTLRDANVTGSFDAGTLAGANRGTVRVVSATGDVTGTSGVGGLVGDSDGRVVFSTAVVTVTGGDGAGGLVGLNGGTLVDSYASTALTADGAVGGVAGINTGTVERTYVTGPVSGTSTVGGLVGFNDGGTLRDAYWDGGVTGQTAAVGQDSGTASGTANLTTGEMTGLDALGNLSALSFRGPWQVSLGYPALAWEFVPGPVYDVRGLSAPSGVSSGSTLSVDVTVENRADGVDNRTVALDVNGDQFDTDDPAIPGTTTRNVTFPYTVASNPETASLSLLGSTLDDEAAATVDVTDFVTLSGTVTNVSGTIPNASVSVVGTPSADTTDANGSYEMAVRDGETLQLEVSKTFSDGSSRTRFVSVTTSGPTTRNLSLALGVSALAGNGTASDPYVVTNATGLQTVEQDLDANYTLGSDVDASATADWNGGQGFDPLGNDSTLFDGTFDGEGHMISGLTTDRPDAKRSGLFGRVGPNGVVGNVTLVRASVVSDTIGVLAGWNEGTIRNVSTAGSVDGYIFVGGVVGRNDGTVERSSSNATVDGTVAVGGVVGRNEGAVERSSSNATVNGSDTVGGVVGGNTATVRRSYASGSATGDRLVGGVVGDNDQTVDRVYGTAAVSGDTAEGAIVGENDGSLTDAYWDRDASGQTSAVDGSGSGTTTNVVGLTTAEMTADAAPGNMTAFSFPGEWQVTPGYPGLAWQVNGAPVASDDSYNTSENATLRVSAPGVLGNDSDPDGDDLSFSRISGPSDGSLTLFSNGSFEYTPDPGFVGIDTFGYEVTDGSLTDSATVTVYVSDFVDVAPADLPGSGTASDPYVITNASELQAVDDDPGANYTLGSDVDARGTRFWNEGAGFEPLGDRFRFFTGTFDGANHTIRGLTVDRPATPFVGPFAVVAGTVANVTVENATVTGNLDTGGLAGGITGTVRDVSVDATVDGSKEVGGLVGRHTGTVAASAVTGSVNGSQRAGGLAGVTTGPIDGSYATTTVTGDEFVGGLVGINGGSLNRSYATGDVTGEGFVGGLVGSSNEGVNRSYATGDVTTVTGNESVGGLLGRNRGALERSYWDPAATGQRDAVGTVARGGFQVDVEGLSTAAMTGSAAPGNMTAFAFAENWQVSTGYPALAWETVGTPTPTVAVPDTFRTAENGTLRASAPGVLGNDLVAAGDSLSASLVDGPTHGSATVDADGSFDYVPDLGFDGTDTFTYAVTDGDGTTSTATVTVAVSSQVDVAVTDLPGSGTVSDPYLISNASELQAMEDDLTAAYALESDIDATGTALWNDGTGFDPVGAPTFSPGDSFNRTLFGRSHTIRGLTIERYRTDDVGLFGGVGPGGAVRNLTLTETSIVGRSFVGAVAGDNDGQIERSAVGGSVTGVRSIGGLAGSNGGLITRSYATASVEGTGAQIGGLVGFAGGTIRKSYATGDVSGNRKVGGLVGKATADTLERSYSTGTVTGESEVGGFVGDQNDPVLDAYWDVETSGQSNAAGSLDSGTTSDITGLTTAEMTGSSAATTMSALDFSGTWSTTRRYPVLDWQVAANGPPVAENDSYRTTVNTSLSVGAPGVLGNDSDPEGDALTASVLTRPSNGTLGLNADGSFEYDPDDGFAGTDTFTYEATDALGETDRATVTVAVESVDDPPTARNDSYTLTENTTLSVPAPGVLGNDSDPEGAALSASLVSGPSNGSVTLSTNGSVEYTPVSGFRGLDTFSYEASDPAGNTDTATVTLNVTASNVAPNTGDDDYTILQGETLSVPAPGVLGNDTDADGDSLSASLVTRPSNGSVTLLSNGSLDYAPDTGFAGVDTFTYAASDGNGASDTATVSVDVNGPPTAANESYLVLENERLSVSAPGVLADDSDPEGGNLTVTVTNGPTDGLLNADADGSFEYAPDAGFTGVDSFTYEVTDPDNLTDTATVFLTVAAELTERWNATAPGPFQYASPAAGPDRAFVGGLDDTVAALFRANGSQAWTFDRAGSLADSSPTYQSGTVYVGSGGGVLYALNASTGGVEWTYSTDSAIVSTPRVVDGTVYVGSNDGTVLAVDASTGSAVWTAETGDAVLSKPAVGGGSVYVTADDGELVALDESTGAHQWSVDVGPDLGRTSPAYRSDVVYVASDRLYAVDTTTRSVSWSRDYGGGTAASPVVANGSVYVGAENGRVTAFDRLSGAVEWRWDAGAAVRGTPTVTGEGVVVTAADGTVAVLAPASGVPAAVGAVEGRTRSAPAVAGDTVYVGAGDRLLAVGDLGDALSSSETAIVADGGTTDTATNATDDDSSRNRSTGGDGDRSDSRGGDGGSEDDDRSESRGADGESNDRSGSGSDDGSSRSGGR